jgi:aminopeptidase YwaD
MIINNLKTLATGILPVAFLILSGSSVKKTDITVKELQNHIRYLSSDDLKGRLTGSPGDSLAAIYIRKELTSYGLKPLAENGWQNFKVTKKVLAGKNSSLSLNGTGYALGKDFTPVAFSSDAGLESDVVFAGYGFNISLDTLKWNDFSSIDVKGKWVMILRADPETDNTRSAYIPFSGDRNKALLAKDLGAAGVLFVAGEAADPQDQFESLGQEAFSVGLPVLRIKREVADAILSSSKNTISGLEKKLNETRKPLSFNANVKVKATTEITSEEAGTRNVIMVLPGEDPILKNEYVIIGAHFDHLGMGGPGSSSRAVDTIAVHHGADDNASGVAMMLELAGKFAGTNGSHKRSIVFIAFSGEEMGLLGSKYFTDHPWIDLSKVNAMFNLDMVGRLNENRTVQISGAGTAEGLKKILYADNDTNKFKITLSDEGYGPSDHSSFYGKNIPVVYYSTGAHLDYHTPSDTWDKINFTGMVEVSSLIYKTASDLASEPGRLAFREAGPKVETGAVARRKGVTLGIMPDFAGNVKNGLRADFVTPGKPAALGGMKKNDIITAINGKPVNNIQDYMYRMGQLKRGETITVEVLRDNKKEVLLIQL